MVLLLHWWGLLGHTQGRLSPGASGLAVGAQSSAVGAEALAFVPSGRGGSVFIFLIAVKTRCI